MKKSNIKTLEDLREFLIGYCEENPEDDCIELICNICEEHGWIYTGDSDLEYDDEDYVYDGRNLLSCYRDEGWYVSKMEGIDMKYKGRDMVVREDDENYYIKYALSNRGGFYPKSDWEIEKALEYYVNTCEEKMTCDTTNNNNNNKKRNIMATKKVYPFIHAKMFDLEDNNDRKDVVFDAREVESYEFWQGEEDEDECVTVNFKSGKKMNLYLTLDQELYPGDNLITAIDMVQYSHFWHDNEDSLPDEDEE